ncbi:MAG: hypothetical protein OXT63_14585 [Gemmatimonadota bacterium]|nr:hypothetical protein [Gemmatimonadota bacterium]
MARKGRIRVGLAGFVAVAAMVVSHGPLHAQDSWLVGTWEATAEATGMPGPTIAMTWTIEAAEDGTFTGSWTGEAEGTSYTREMSDISVDGDTFGFTVRIEDQGQVGSFVFEGTVAEGEVSGTFEVRPEGMPAVITGSFSGGRAEVDGAWR